MTELFKKEYIRTIPSHRVKGWKPKVHKRLFDGSQYTLCCRKWIRVDRTKGAIFAVTLDVRDRWKYVTCKACLNRRPNV